VPEGQIELGDRRRLFSKFKMGQGIYWGKRRRWWAYPIVDASCLSHGAPGARHKLCSGSPTLAWPEPRGLLAKHILNKVERAPGTQKIQKAGSFGLRRYSIQPPWVPVEPKSFATLRLHSGHAWRESSSGQQMALALGTRKHGTQSTQIFADRGEKSALSALICVLSKTGPASPAACQRATHAQRRPTGRLRPALSLPPTTLI